MTSLPGSRRGASPRGQRTAANAPDAKIGSAATSTGSDGRSTPGDETATVVGSPPTHSTSSEEDSWATNGDTRTREALDTKADDLFREISRVVRTIAAGHADLLTLLAQFAALRLPPSAEQSLVSDEFAPEEIATAMAVSPQSASAQLTFACTVARRLPNAVDALRAGVLDLQRLQSLEKAVHPLDDRTAARVEAHVLAGGARPNRRAFTDACRRAVARIDPEGTADRAETRRKDRRVWISPDEDGTSALTAVLPTEDAEACYQRIDQAARSISANRSDGDDRTRAQIRADVLVDLLTGRGSHATPMPCDIQVVVPATTLMGLSDDPGEIPGYGPIPARIAREMAKRPGSTWRRILTDPQGHLIEVADRRLPSAAQVRHVRARNRTCVFTGCTRPSRRTDTDHTISFSEDGRTLTKNLGPLCRRHHRMKHRGHWQVTQPQEGTFVWTSPLGRTSVTTPDTYLEVDVSPGTTTKNRHAEHLREDRGHTRSRPKTPTGAGKDPDWQMPSQTRPDVARRESSAWRQAGSGRDLRRREPGGREIEGVNQREEHNRASGAREPSRIRPDLSGT
ncbi:DUF222 domain-containing protein [Parafrankia sp. FMc6]|uniref:HNH endonuclease signature motif containing protein n=1 Tax=Parafrankia soli TaxID=2599596 RepID=UPI0034D6476E